MVASVLPTPNEVRAAYERIAGHVVHTPLVPSAALSELAGGEVQLKLECAQTGGSFKLRGALNVLLAMDAPTRARGVVASSAGNHGIGIAIAAQLVGAKATVFVPRTAPAVKRTKIASYGATIDADQPNYDAAEAAARQFAARTGATFVSPCTGRSLLAGAGTVAKEIMDALPAVGTIVLGVGGGGLAGGVAGYAKGVSPGVRVIGAQSVRTNAMSLAMASGQPTDIPDAPTLADGLAGLVDAEMLAQGRAALDGIVEVEEPVIARAMTWLRRELGVRVEGSGAVGVAAIQELRIKPRAFPAVVVVSGGNVDDSVARLVNEGAD